MRQGAEYITIIAQFKTKWIYVVIQCKLDLNSAL